jgi:hypothetical protein
VAAPASLPWQKGSGAIAPEALRRFQAALRSKHSDLRVRPDGKWDFYFDEVLRDLGAPALAAAPFTVTIDNTFWTNTMAPPDDTAEAWNTGIPTEADLFDLSEPAPEGTATAVSMSLPAGEAKVEVLVHHRGLDVREGVDVRVAMLKWIGPATARADDASTWFTGPVPWATAVNDVLNSSGGTTSAVFADNWAFIGNSPPENRKTLVAQTIDNFKAGVASFGLSLTGLAPGTVVLLVAVVRAGADSAITATALKELALTDPHVAVRSLTVT